VVQEVEQIVSRVTTGNSNSQHQGIGFVRRLECAAKTMNLTATPTASTKDHSF